MTFYPRLLLLAALLLVGVLVYSLQSMLGPFLIATALAYLGDPVVDRLERFGMSRTMGVCVVFLALGLIWVVAALLLVPLLLRQIDLLREIVPTVFAWMQNTMAPWLTARFGITVDWFEPERIRELLARSWSSDIWAPVLKNLTNSGMAALQWAINIGLVPIVTFYLLRDWDHIVTRVRDLIPRRQEAVVVSLASECDEVLAAFVRGQLLVMLGLGIFFSVGLLAIGLKLGLLIGVVAGIAGVVPFLGAVVGIAAGLLAAWFQFGDLLHLVLVLLVFGTGQMIESMVLTPLLVGDRIGLHPVAVIFAVLAGGELFGFVGVLLALPVAAVIVVLLRHLHSHYLNSAMYGDVGGLDAEDLVE